MDLPVTSHAAIVWQAGDLGMRSPPGCPGQGHDAMLLEVSVRGRSRVPDECLKTVRNTVKHYCAITPGMKNFVEWDV